VRPSPMLRANVGKQRKAQHRARLLFAAIERAAEAGKVCPSNVDLAAAGGYTTAQSMGRVIARLCRDGLLRIIGAKSNWLIIEIVASGKRTATPLFRKAPLRKKGPASTRRSCLACGIGFESAGPQNRLCVKCTHEVVSIAAWMG